MKSEKVQGASPRRTMFHVKQLFCKFFKFANFVFTIPSPIDFLHIICYNISSICPVGATGDCLPCRRTGARPRRYPLETVVLAFANQKGGVGKTTSTVNVAAALGHLGHKTLLIDCDPQGNASTGIGVVKRGLRHSLYSVLLGESRAEDAVIETEYKNLSVLPTTIDLAGAEFDLIEREHKEAVLKEAIAPLVGQYDFILIDCPPSLGLLTVNALSAANGVVIPMQCEYFALEGLTQLMSTVRRIKQYYNPALVISGILITMYDGRLNLSTQVLAELKKYYADKLFRTVVPRNVKLSEAPSFGKPIFYHDKYSRGSLAYLEIAKELAERQGF